MSAKNSLHRLAVSSPCSQDWNSMIGNDRVRFCEHCSLHVHNISEMTRVKALRLIENSQGRICIRYYRDPNGEVVTQSVSPRLYQLRRRVSRVAAGAFSATLSVSAAVAQSPSGPQLSLTPVVQSPDRWALGAAVAGTITDPNGAVIPGVSVALTGVGTSFFTSTNDSGEFRFEGLASGSYTIRVQTPGFNPADAQFFLQQDAELRVDEELSVANIEAEVEIESGSVETRQFVTTGVVAIASPSHPFVKAAFDDNLEELSSLIAETDVNLRDKTTGTTALDHAVDNGNREMVELLLSRGANVNARNGSGRTALMRIGEEATSDLVWDLLNAGAEVNVKSETGETALITAAYQNNVEALKALLDAGADVSNKDEDGQTALMVAAENGHLQNVRALVLAGANLDQQDVEGKNALTLAIESEHRAVIRFLRSKGAVESVARVAVQE
jgi:ankyrin repeat protein